MTDPKTTPPSKTPYSKTAPVSGTGEKSAPAAKAADAKTAPASGAGLKSVPPPSTTKDCKAPKGMVAPCTVKDQLVELVELVEVYKKGSAPDWKQGPLTARNQFINLDSKVDSKKDHPEFGRAIWLKARLQWVTGDKTRSLAGKDVYWYTEEAKTNNKKLSKDQKGSFDSAGGGLEKKATTTNKDGWTDPMPFYLSLCGGDKFTLYATTDKGYKSGKKAGPYTVWRKFWFQVSEMVERGGKGQYTLPGSVTNAIAGGYKKAKIEFSEKGPRGKIPHQGNTPTGDMDKLGKTHFVQDDLVPFKCHLMTCDYGGQTHEPKEVKDKLKSAAWTSPNWYLLWPHGGAMPWKLEAKYKSGKDWKDIPAAHLKTQKDASQPGYQKVSIDFSKGPVTPSAKDPVDIKLKLKCAGPNLFLGWGGGRAHILLCTGMLRDLLVSGDRDPTQRSDTVHEMGHALGLVNMAPSAAGAHNAWHDTAHSHHCKQPANKCAMFWQSSTTRLTTFHSTGGKGCNEHLRTQDFSRSVMQPLWK